METLSTTLLFTFYCNNFALEHFTCMMSFVKTGQLMNNLCAFSHFTKLEIMWLFSFFNLGLLTHLENKTKISRWEMCCVVFMNESEIRLKERIEGERYEEISNFQSKNDNTM